MRIYLDNNATTAIHPGVLEVLEETLRDVYGNASSIHREGQSARRVLENARESVATLIRATARELVFTSGGSESNNDGLFGVARRGGGFRIARRPRACAGGPRGSSCSPAAEVSLTTPPSLAWLRRRGVSTSSQAPSSIRPLPSRGAGPR